MKKKKAVVLLIKSQESDVKRAYDLWRKTAEFYKHALQCQKTMSFFESISRV